MACGGQAFEAIDTAGIRDRLAASPLEARGMVLAARRAAASDLCLWLVPAGLADPCSIPPVPVGYGTGRSF